MLGDSSSARSNFAANVRTKRISLGLSQEDVARKMSERGFRWHQATTYKVEAGTRMVPVEEAFALAQLLETTVETLMAEPAPEHLAELVTATGRLIARQALVSEAAESFGAAWTALSLTVTEVESSGDELPELAQEALRQARGRLTTSSRFTLTVGVSRRGGLRWAARWGPASPRASEPISDEGEG